MKKNILFISPDFNLACGVSKHIYTLLTSEKLNSDFDLFFITNGGNALPKLNKAGVNYKIESFKTNSILHFDILKNLRWLKEYCAQKQINIIHSHHRYPEYLSNIVKKSLGIRTVVTAHNFARGLKNFSYKSDRIIAISNSVANHLKENFNVPENKLVVLYNCIAENNKSVMDTERIKEKNSIRKDQKVLLYAGRLSEEKGVNVLLNSIKLVNKVHPEILLIIIGNNDQQKRLNKSVIESENIRILPPQENIDEFYSIADIVILPSLQEGLGYVMLEAGLKKVPFIGSRTGGIAEFIEDGIEGFLFEPGNSIGLAAKIEFVLDNSLTAQNSSLKLNEKVIRLCNCSDYFEKLTGLYKKLLVN